MTLFIIHILFIVIIFIIICNTLIAIDIIPFFDAVQYFLDNHDKIGQDYYPGNTYPE